MKSLDGSSFSIQKFHSPTLQAVVSGQIHDLQGSTDLENRAATERHIASGWTAVKSTRRKRKQLVNAATDTGGVSQTKNANEFGVHEINVH